MVINIYATWNSLRLLFQPGICLPHATYGTFMEMKIPFPKVIRGVALDKDNCFSKPDALEVWPEYEE